MSVQGTESREFYTRSCIRKNGFKTLPIDPVPVPYVRSTLGTTSDMYLVLVNF
jgi:hypothetical protein